MDKKYWENYYEINIAPEQASLFAQFVLENYLKKQDSLVEFGCGNGRDSVFFAKNRVNVTAVDQCEAEILALKEENKLPNIKFLSDDFTKLKAEELFDIVYSRFTLHSITEKEEDETIKWVYEHIKNKGYFLIEARGKKNELYMLGTPVDGEPDAYIYENHFRRFVEMDKLQKKLTDIGFNIVYAEENTGFAPFHDTDYTFMRIVARKE